MPSANRHRLDRAFSQVRGALWGLVTVMGLALLYMGNYIWQTHLVTQNVVDTVQTGDIAEQSDALSRFWAEHERQMTELRNKQERDVESIRAERRDSEARSAADQLRARERELETTKQLTEFGTVVRDLVRRVDKWEDTPSGTKHRR